MTVLRCASMQVGPATRYIKADGARPSGTHSNFLIPSPYLVAKSWQLGWYASTPDKTVTVVKQDIIDNNWSWTTQLMGIVDYANPAASTVLVKLETGNDIDYFINFNRQRDFNSGTVEAGNQVTITEADNNGEGYSNSLLLAKLSAGQSSEIGDFIVTVDAINTNTDTADITIGLKSMAPSMAPSQSLEPTSTSMPTSDSDTNLFINCGVTDGTLVTDGGGNEWMADESTDPQYYDTGSRYSNGNDINISGGANTMEIYQTERYGDGENMTWMIPGTYVQRRKFGDVVLSILLVSDNVFLL